MISGVVPTILAGVLGAFLAELIRVLPLLKQGKPPRGWELLASVIQILLGAGAVLFGWEQQPILQIAVTGAAFPLLFSAAVNGAKPPAGGAGDVSHENPSFWDHIAGRF